VRLAMLGAMAAMLLVALAVPEAFDADGVLFGVAYLAVRLLHLVLCAIAGKKDPDLLGAVLRMVPSATLGPALLLTAGFLDGPAQGLLWMGALAIDYLGVTVGRGRGWRVSPEHFAERHGLIVIIALGESIVAIGIGAAGLPLDAGVVAAAVVGIAVIAALWWAYFDVYAIYAQRHLSDARGVARAAGARLLQLPPHAHDRGHRPLRTRLEENARARRRSSGRRPRRGFVRRPRAVLPTHVAFRLRLVRTVGRGRAVTAIVLLALTPAALEVPALGALAFVAGVCCALTAYDVIHYRAERIRVRQAR
jgi:hypothetical protein